MLLEQRGEKGAAMRLNEVFNRVEPEPHQFGEDPLARSQDPEFRPQQSW
jgi:hypothetical protein